MNKIKLLGITLILACLALPDSIAAAGVEIWLSPTQISPANIGNNGAGSGTPADPFITPNADTFFNLIHGLAVLDAQAGGTNAGLNAKYIIPEYSTIHLMPGTFRVRDGTGLIPGQRFPLTPKDGWKIRGAGMDVTILKPIDEHLQPPVPKFAVISGAQGNNNSWEWCANDVEVSDLTVDCNMHNMPAVAVGNAINLSGSNNKVSRVHAINWGSRHDPGSEGECFVLNIDAHFNRPQTYQNNIIEECLVDRPAPMQHSWTTTAIGMGNQPDATPQPVGPGWIIRNNVVKDIATGNQFGQASSLNAIGVGGFGLGPRKNFSVIWPGIKLRLGWGLGR